MAERLFLPYHRDTSARVPYGSWLAKFCASVAWRVLFVYSKIDPLRHFSEGQRPRVGKALDAWKRSDVRQDRKSRCV